MWKFYVHDVGFMKNDGYTFIVFMYSIMLLENWGVLWAMALVSLFRTGLYGQWTIDT